MISRTVQQYTVPWATVMLYSKRNGELARRGFPPRERVCDLQLRRQPHQDELLPCKIPSLRRFPICPFLCWRQYLNCSSTACVGPLTAKRALAAATWSISYLRKGVLHTINLSIITATELLHLKKTQAKILVGLCFVYEGAGSVRVLSTATIYT